MKERDWETLIWALQHRSCIVLLGPELPLTSGEVSATLEHRLAEVLRGDVSASGHHLAAVAQQYALELGRADLERQVVRFYDSQREAGLELHAALAALPLSLVVTSSHDALFEAALRSAGKAPLVEHYHFRGDNEAILQLGSVESPLLYQLYGSPREPSSMVLTEGDLLDFLVAVVSKNPPLPSNIRSELKKKGRSFLFIGFGLRHWHLRILLHVLGFSGAESRSFALEPLASAAPAELEQTIVFYRTGYRIEVYDMKLAEFVGQLRRRFDTAAPRATAVPAATGGPQAAQVFICHASEDRQVAQRISEELGRAGLRPWLDKSSLEGGDEWDPVIERSIGESDYFLVLQSRSLAGKSFSYLNREINLALSRQKFARSGIRFIIPVQIDDSPLIDDLKPFQAIPIRGDKDLSHLTSSIKRDFQRRARGV